MTIDVRFRLRRGDFTLDIDLSLPEKGITALFGPSGCGKTTLLRAIAGLEGKCEGSLRIGNVPWQDERHFLPPHKRAVGYVFQEAGLFPHLSVRGNIAYGLNRVAESERRISLERAVDLLDIAHLLERRPQHLSGGEAQRVAIARALAANPSLLLMDEPLAALDAARKREILPLLAALQRELSLPVLYVSHARDEIAQLADHLVLMEDGRVRASGALNSLFTRLDLGLSQGPETESVIEATVTGHDPEYALTYMDFPGGRFAVAHNGLPPGQKTRLQILARDVSLTLERQHGTSILNIFPATVEEMRPDGPAQVTVRLLIGPVPVLARITRKSAVELGIEPGMSVHAQIKSVALLS